MWTDEWIFIPICYILFQSLPNLSNLSLISDTSLPDSIINPQNLSNISSNASINRFDEDYLNLESIKCIEGIENNEFNERESIKCISSTSIISPSNSEELPIPCQSKKVIRQGLSDTPAREGGQGIEGETASPAREGGQGCSLSKEPNGKIIFHVNWLPLEGVLLSLTTCKMTGSSARCSAGVNLHNEKVSYINLPLPERKAVVSECWGKH